MYEKIIGESCRFFADLPKSELDQFLSLCTFRHIPQGTTLWHEGDAGDHAVLILNGKLGLKKKAQFGNRHLIVGIHTAGSMIGENSMLNSEPRTVTAEAIETTDLVIITAEQFETLLETRPQLGAVILRHIAISTSRRLEQAYERLTVLF